jgi:hypothetical protein
MKRAIFAGFLAVLPLSAEAQVITCLKPNGMPEPCESRQPARPTTPAPTTQAPKPTLTPRNSAWIPPVEYDKPFKGKLTEIRVTPEIMRAICPKTTFPVTLGCSYPPVHDNQCVIIMLEDKHLEAAGWSAGYVRRHEIGHCNGFPADHRGARPLALSER